MQIRDALLFFNLHSEDSTIVSDIYDNSKDVHDKSIFIAIDKGINYVEEAVKNGAIIVISNQQSHHKNVIIIPKLKEQLTAFSLYFYGHPEDKLKLIGVTGTNGKSTCAYLIHSLLHKSLLITTVSGIKNSVITNNTTPNGLEIVHALNKAIKLKKDYVVMEISSIGIAEKRVNTLQFSHVLLTNLTSDHLDYHHTIQAYHKCKIDYLKKQSGIIVVNSDDKVCRGYIDKFNKSVTYRVNQDSIRLNDENGVIYQFDSKNIMTTKLLGYFNLSNVVGAMTLCSQIVSLNKLLKKVKRIKPLQGRLNIVHHKPLIIIDYAHTEEALKASLIEVNKLISGKLIVVFGAGGERDKSKRNKYGELVMHYASVGIVTNDNPRNENEDEIINDIVGDLDFYFIIKKNRSEAIKKAIEYASKNDAILITGKGHEQYQIINNKKIPYSDYEEVKRWIKKR